MSLKVQFNIGFDFVKEDDVIVLKTEGKIDTYRFKKPIEHPLYKGFYLIPEFNSIVINKQGDVLSLCTGELRTWTVSKPVEKTNTTGGYHYLPAICAFDTRRVVGRHRLILLVFTEYDIHPATRWVNHKDGIPGNDTLDNLEWVTPGQNIQHAYDNGLHSNKTVAVTLRNWKTGFEKEYTSLALACRELNLVPETMYTRLHRENFAVRFADGWRIKYAEAKWVELDEYHKHASQVAVYVRDVRNNRVFTFSSIAEASIRTKIDSSIIVSHCSRLVANPANYFNFRYVNGFTKWPEFSKDQLELLKMNSGNQGPCGIVAYDKVTNERLWFKLLDDAALTIGISPITLRKLAKANGVRQDLKFEQVIIV